MLECINVQFAYGQRKSLQDVSFDLGPGIIGLFGQNGSGKSTLLKILGGSLPIKHGAIKIAGCDALNADGYTKSSSRKNFGILFQETSSDEKISATDNLFYAALLMGVDRARINFVVEQALEFSGLKSRAKDVVKKLSGGMRRRLELYRTFLHEPKVLLLDEPTAGLDVAEKRKFHEFLIDYQQKHQALVLISSHSPEELLLAHRVLFMAEGKVVADGSPQSLLSALDYLRLSFRLNSEQVDFDPKALAMFDVAHDKKQARLFGKIYSHHLPLMLKDQSFFNSHIAGFTVDKPSLADAYAELTGATHD